MKQLSWFSALAVALPLIGASAPLMAADKLPPKEALSFGNLKATSPDIACSRSLAWLKAAGKTDAATVKQFEAVWAQSERSVLDRVAASLALGDPEAARLLAEARDPARPAPTSVPALFKDAKRPAFFRANLAMAYALGLSNRRVYEESMEVLKIVKPEDVVDPAAYFFHRAVAEHALLLKTEANRSIVGLMEDVADAPDRYKMVGILMYQDMQNWKQKDLGEIVRKMDNIERRLELARGGPKTQKIQKEVVLRLDEIIKQLENPSDCNGGCCPDGGQPGNSGGNPNKPMQDSRIAKNSGPGNVDQKKLKGLATEWGKLPPKEKTTAKQDIIKGMPERQRELIETYRKKLSQSQPAQP